MKTNVNMVRKMGDFEVIQRTKDGMFNASSLIKQWNTAAKMKKNINHFEELSSTKEFIQELENQVIRNSVLPDSQVLIKTRSKTNNRGVKEPGEVWMHPYLFIDFAMWLNPKFKLQVIKFIHDQLIEFRHLAGDNYKSLSGAVAKFSSNNPDVYQTIAKMLNYIVFGKHESGIRQFASSHQLKELSGLQEKAAFLIEMGYVETFDQLRNALRKIYRKKHNGRFEPKE